MIIFYIGKLSDCETLVPREKALKEVIRPNNQKRPVLSVPYDPILLALTTNQSKHWTAMVDKRSISPIPINSLEKR